MSAPSLSWEFENGYSELLDTASVRLIQESGPAVLGTSLKIKDILTGKKNLELSFTLGKTVSGSISSFTRWILKPESEVKVTLIPEKNPFLGNFRVPAGNYAVQWKVIPTVSAGISIKGSDTFSATAGTRVTHTWVEIFSTDKPVADAIANAWENCVNPFDPGQASKLSSRQVLRWNWTGLIRITAGIGWSLEKGWTLEANPSGLSYRMPLKTGITLKNQIKINTSGHFYIQLSKKKDLLKFSIIREKGKDSTGSAALGLSFSHLPSLRAVSNLADPLLEPAEKEIKKCLARKLTLALAAEASKWHRKKRVFKASWKEPFSEELNSEYDSILCGAFPLPRKGFSCQGRYENIHGRNFAVKLNIFNRITGIEKQESSFDSVTADPGGDLLFEKGISKTSVRYKWDEIEFVRLAFSRKVTGRQISFNWNWEAEDKYSRIELIAILRAVLHGRVIPGFSIPGNLKYPLNLKISASTDFSSQGIRQVRKTKPSLQWETLVEALSLVYPGRYKKNSFWRDWIDCPEVRQEITRNPVHCHLDSCYPVKGRTDMQRMQVTSDYRRALRFLEIMDLWQEGRDPLDLLNKNLDFPIFLYFHMLCPPINKHSLLSIRGDWEMDWEQLPENKQT